MARTKADMVKWDLNEKDTIDYTRGVYSISVFDKISMVEGNLVLWYKKYTKRKNALIFLSKTASSVIPLFILVIILTFISIFIVDNYCHKLLYLIC